MKGIRGLTIRSKAVVSAARPGTFDDGYSHRRTATSHVQPFHADGRRDADRSESVPATLANGVITEAATTPEVAGNGC
jgi:hypothetical protein